MLDIFGVSDVIEVGDRPISIILLVLLCLKGDYFLMVAWGCEMSVSEFFKCLG